jgi:hypothetical protein
MRIESFCACFAQMRVHLSAGGISPPLESSEAHAAPTIGVEVRSEQGTPKQKAVKMNSRVVAFLLAVWVVGYYR